MSKYDVLKVKILNCFIRFPKEQCTVTYLTKVLQEEKYKISRVMSSMEKDGLLDRSNSRMPMLTTLGEEKGKMLAERMDVITNHLIFEGVEESDAIDDALLISMYCSDNTWEAFHATEEKYRLKQQIQEMPNVTGRQIVKILRSGVYKMPFVIYKLKAYDGNNISIANDGFEYPCKMLIREDKGEIVLRAKTITRFDPESKETKNGVITAVSYWEDEHYVRVPLRGGVGTVPLDAFYFHKRGKGSESLLCGSAKLKFSFLIGGIEEYEKEAIFSFVL